MEGKTLIIKTSMNKTLRSAAFNTYISNLVSPRSISSIDVSRDVANCDIQSLFLSRACKTNCRKKKKGNVNIRIEEEWKYLVTTSSDLFAPVEGEILRR